MIETTTGDELFEAIAFAVAERQAGVARMVAEHVQDRVGIDVEYVGDHIIRSRPGEPPRRETGNLQSRIYGDAIAEPGDIVEAAVWTDAEYAADLESRMRPILSDLTETYLPDFIDAAVSGIEKD